ncbi:MAG: TAT-variant-translocated molybdopterin oxidoreductase [Planctomycetota bacterium]
MNHDTQRTPDALHGIDAASPERDTLRLLGDKRGRELWRSVEELAGSESFAEFVRREYPSQLHKYMDPPQRRDFLKLMGASLALAGVSSSCTRQPAERILPYARTPESTIPGRPVHYATAMPWPTGAIGLLVESHAGRPTKIEGNPLHPASLGATDAIAQAAVLELYDPDRSKAITHRGRISTWDALLTELRAALTAQAPKQGAGLRVLTETVTSPTLAAQLQALLAAYPQASWHVYEPLHQGNARDGAELAFGRAVACQHELEKADVILSLESDFLGNGPEGVRATKQFASRRRVRVGDVAMNRLYVVESAPTITGAMADHRRALKSGEIGLFARALLDRIDGKEASDERWAWLRAIADDLAQNRGKCLVLAGASQPAEVHALAHALNARLDNVGKTVRYSATLDASDGGREARPLQALVADMSAGLVDCLVVLGGNPVYTAPGELDFERALERVPLRVHLAPFDDETSARCDWHVPAAHFLESWSDARASDGTCAIVQPLIAPLFGGKSAHEVVAALLDRATVTSYELVRAHWQTKLPPGDFEKEWRRALHDGVIADTALGSLAVTPRRFDFTPRPASEGLEIVFRPDSSVWDGRFANNGWLQELPKPLTKLTWDNAVHVAPRTAERLGFATGDVVELEVDGRSVRGPVWIAPGQAEDCIGVQLGFGRTAAGSLGTGVGFDANVLRAASAPWSTSGVRVRKLDLPKHRFASTQEHDDMEGRDIIRVGTVDRFRENPRLVEEKSGAHATGHAASLYPPHASAENAWGMVIDLNACTACGACVTACQSENNIPVVGKEEVARGREMHWLRVDRYFEGERDNPEVHVQPIPCMHCENAPCEVVCPVGATTHSPEGLNEMTYNRCVGTRYCSNNCPYKVRRFNFFLYSDFATESLKLQRNPDVTVRSRGVMEKCTYCVQRISEARIQAKKEDRPIRDGDVRTACQAVCPADAIVFGDINDAESAVSRLKREPHNYGLLEELNTFPRTTYLAKVKNPNPDFPA